MTASPDYEFGVGPAHGGAAVTPSDANELADITRAIYIGADGDLAVVMADGSALTFVGLTAGALLPLSVKKVKSTGTTATSIVALW